MNSSAQSEVGSVIVKKIEQNDVPSRWPAYILSRRQTVCAEAYIAIQFFDFLLSAIFVSHSR